MTTIATWSVKLKPGEPYKFTALQDDELDLVLRITNASLGFEIADANARTVVKLTKQKSYINVDDEELPDAPEVEEIALCALTPGRIEQVTLNVDFSDELQQIEVVGPNEIHLLGNFINQEDDDADSEIFSDEDGPNGYRLDEVSSDVEDMEARFDFEDDDDSDEEDDAARFEEVKETKQSKALKRAADAMDEDDAAPSAGSAEGLSKSQKKKLAKKLKNEQGAAVSVTETVTTTATVSASPDSKKKGEEKKKEDKKEKKKGGDKDEKEKPASATAGETKTLDGGLVVLDTKVGTGKMSKKGNTLSMRYIGKLEDGKIFDSNTKGAPFKFRLGAGEVIAGWDRGLVGMQVGGERVLTVPAPLGYGKKGSKPEIPPNATLRFEVKLLDMK